MSRLTIKIPDSPFRHEVTIWRSHLDPDKTSRYIVKIGCREFSFAKLARLYRLHCDHLNRSPGKGKGKAEGYPVELQSLQEEYGDKNHWRDWCCFVNQLCNLIHLSTGKPLSAFAEPEKPAEPEQRYVVVNLGAEAMDDACRYIVGDIWQDCKPATVKAVRENYIKLGTTKEVADLLVWAAYQNHGWHCEVREWPEKLWCVKNTDEGDVSFPWLVALGTDGEIAPIAYSKDKQHAWHRKPHGYSLKEAERLAANALELCGYTCKILPYPPPEKPVAVQFAVRDNVGDWWYFEYGSARFSSVVHFMTFAEAKRVKDQAIKQCDCEPCTIVGFDEHGNEVEVK